MMKRFVCHYCGCDALEPEPRDFAYTCLVCLRRHSGLLLLKREGEECPWTFIRTKVYAPYFGDDLMAVTS
jgi:hypothetical protein